MNKEEFYILLDDLLFDTYFATYKNRWLSYERVLVKVLQLGTEVVVIETTKGKDKIVYDNRQNSTKDLLEFDLTFLKVMERFCCDADFKNQIFEKIEGIGSWSRVVIPNFSPNDENLKIFYQRKRKIDRNNQLMVSFSELVKDIVFIKYEEMQKIWQKVLDRQ